MEKKLEQLANDLMSLSKDDAQRLQIIIKAKLMPEVEKQRGLLQQQQNPQMAQMGRPNPNAPRIATQRDMRMQGLLNRQDNIMPMVGKKKFAYTKKGKDAAKKYAKKKKMKMKSKGKY